MSDADDTRLPTILQALAKGERQDASEELLPLVYAELRRVAHGLIQHERPGQTLQPTALVHEAYLRVAGDDDNPQQWDGRKHFFGAATEAMRRILIDQARRKQRKKHGGDQVRIEATLDVAVEPPNEDVLQVDEVLQRLEAAEPHLRQIVNLRYFGGFTVAETAQLLGKSESTIAREWRFVRAWLRQELGD